MKLKRNQQRKLTPVGHKIVTLLLGLPCVAVLCVAASAAFATGSDLLIVYAGTSAVLSAVIWVLFLVLPSMRTEDNDPVEWPYQLLLMLAVMWVMLAVGVVEAYKCLKSLQLVEIVEKEKNDDEV